MKKLTEALNQYLWTTGLVKRIIFSLTSHPNTHNYSHSQHQARESESTATYLCHTNHLSITILYGHTQHGACLVACHAINLRVEAVILQRRMEKKRVIWWKHNHSFKMLILRQGRKTCLTHTHAHRTHKQLPKIQDEAKHTYIYSTICRKIKKCTSANPVLLNYVSDSLSCAFLNLLICIFQHKSHDLPVCLLKKKVGNRRVEST